MNILIVDDSRFLRLANERALLKAGHQVLTASDGEEGLRLGIEHQPDLIVLDMLLPKLSGPEVLRALRKNLRTATIPIMVLTSLPSEMKVSCWRKEQQFISKKPASELRKVLALLSRPPKEPWPWPIKLRL